MATTSDRRNADCRPGGKIVRNRRIPAAARTPYARPAKLLERVQPEEPENPNWLSGLIYPAKMIASGAGKILSLFGPDPSSSSSGGDSSENDEEEEVENDESFQGDGRSNKALSSSSKSDSKHVIERLVMQQTFSREEGNELIELIKSRVVDTDGTFDDSIANMRTTAILEARKWLQQKRSGSKKMEHEVDFTALATPSKVNGNGMGSPVDMAKSYMQNRPAWASPSLEQTEFDSPSPSGILQFKEKTPKSTLHTSEMKGSSLSSGSWNILEEIRRVRSKATENLLAASPLTKNSPSSFSPEIDRPQDSLMSNRDITAVAESTDDRPKYGLPDVSASRPSRVDQDDGAVQSMEDQECQKVTDLNSNEDNEVIKSRSTAAENGRPFTASGLTAGHDATQKAGPSKEEINGSLVSSSQAGTDVHMGENLNLKQEPTADMSNVNPSDSVVNGSQNSSSMQQEDLPQELNQPSVEHTSKTKANNAPKERKSRGYTRRGKGRGK